MIALVYVEYEGALTVMALCVSVVAVVIAVLPAALAEAKTAKDATLFVDIVRREGSAADPLNASPQLR